MLRRLAVATAVFASPGAAVAAAVGPGDVATTVKKRSRDALADNWREDRSAPTSTFGWMLLGSGARQGPTKASFDKAQSKAETASRASWAAHHEWVRRVESLVTVRSGTSTAELCIQIIRRGEDAADKRPLPRNGQPLGRSARGGPLSL